MKKEGKTESESVSHQRDLIQNYTLNTRLMDLQQRLDTCQKQKKNSEEAVNPEVEHFLCSAKQYQGQTELTNDMVKAFIERVLVYAEDRIEIEWSFSEKLFTEPM